MTATIQQASKFGNSKTVLTVEEHLRFADAETASAPMVAAIHAANRLAPNFALRRLGGLSLSAEFRARPTLI
jgi:hypothetical protein